MADPSGTAMTKQVITDFNDDIGVNSKYITDSVCIKLTNDSPNYSGFDYSALKNDIKKYYDANKAPSQGNKPSGGGSGGGGGGTGRTYIPGAIANVDRPQPLPDTKEHSFVDLAGYDWAKEAINALGEKNIVSGDENGNFNPQGYVTREEFVKMISNLLNLPAAKGTVSFDDVKDDDWFNDYICRAYENKIISGIGDGCFGTGSNITRQDMSVICLNAINYLGIAHTSENTDYADNDSIADYAAGAVGVLSNLGIINGYDDKTFRPHDFATRAEAAKIIYMLMNL